MQYNEIVGKVAEETGLSRKMVNSIYKAYWRSVMEHITSLPLKEDLSEEEFSRLHPNVNIPSLGKLYVTYDRYTRLRKHYCSAINKH